MLFRSEDFHRHDGVTALGGEQPLGAQEVDIGMRSGKDGGERSRDGTLRSIEFGHTASVAARR